MISVWPLTFLSSSIESIRLEETMVDAILELLITLSLILSGVLVYLLVSVRGGKHNRHAHWPTPGAGQKTGELPRRSLA